MNDKLKIILFAGIISAMILPFSGIITEASAFEPTKKEQKIIKKYVKVTLKIEKLCSDETDRQPICTKLEKRQDRLLFKLNDMGIYTDIQEPDLSHLTEIHHNTRAAVAAGIESIEVEIPKVTGSSSSSCPSCDNSEKTMYVKSAYKDPYTWLGIQLWDHYSGVPSADISSGIISSGFVPQWTGYNQGIVPYCYTSSTTLSANASYGISITMSDYLGSTLISPSTTSQSSYFVWYDTNDQFEYATQNNVHSGPTIACTISNVSVS